MLSELSIIHTGTFQVNKSHQRDEDEDCSIKIALNIDGCLALVPSLWSQQAVPRLSLVFLLMQIEHLLHSG